MHEKNPRVLVGCPTHELKSDSFMPFFHGLSELTHDNFDVLIEDNSPTHNYAEKIRAAGKEWEKTHPGRRFEVIHTENSSESARERIVHGRNLIRERVLNGNYDYFLSLEQDLVPPQNVIEKLLAWNVNVVSAVYLNRKKAENGFRIEIMAGKYFNAEEKAKGVFRDVGFNDILPSRLMEVDYTGVGCMLISRKMLEKISFRVNTNTPHFDDMLFCMDAQHAGHKIFLDSHTWCKHYFNDAFLKTKK